MVDTWAYKATPTKVERLTTNKLAREHAFLCCSREVPRSAEVKLGDELLFYYSDRNPARVVAFGRFRVIAPADHPHPEWFIDAPIDETALRWVVKGSALHDWMVEKTRPTADGEGYLVDPSNGMYPGWPLARVGDASPYDARWFLPRAYLAKVS